MSETAKNTQELKKRTSKLAGLSIVAAILGILPLLLISLSWLFPDDMIVFLWLLGWPPVLFISGLALLFGVIAIIVIKHKPNVLGGRNWATVGICIALLNMLVLYAFSFKVKPIAYKVFCANQLRNISGAIYAYAENNDWTYPTADRWCDLLVQYASTEPNRFVQESFGRQFVCPGSSQRRCSYALNPNTKFRSPSNMVLLFETKGGWNQFGGKEILADEYHRGKGCNILFNNGSVKFIRTEDVNNLNWGDEQKQ